MLAAATATKGKPMSQLVVFGAGTFLGGKLADRSLMRTLCVGLLLLAAMLAAFSLAAQSQFAMVVTLFLFGVSAFLVNPALQTRVMNETEGAPTLASTSNISAFNIGNALGPVLGGIGLSSGAGLLSPSWIGVVLALASFGVALGSVAADRGMAREATATRHHRPVTVSRNSGGT
jgi:DHA1 family inner membrane transport protein